VTGRHLGNFPQAFTHLGLINAVLHVVAAEEDPVDAAREATQRTPSPVKADSHAVDESRPKPAASPRRARGR
jgi:hypothetical protein